MTSPSHTLPASAAPARAAARQAERIDPAPAAEAGEGAGEDARLLEHAYDGIREYDNPLPGWWNAIFIATILFSIGYGVHYHFAGWGKTPAQRYEASLTDYLARRTFSGGGGGGIVAASEDSLARDSQSDVVLEQGAKVFAARCAGCHAADGRGQIGPNLTDLHQLHGSSRMDIFNVVSGGVTGTAMIAWSEQLSGAELNAVSAYAVSLRGKDLSGKPPEGKPVGAFGAGKSGE